MMKIGAVIRQYIRKYSVDREGDWIMIGLSIQPICVIDE